MKNPSNSKHEPLILTPQSNTPTQYMIYTQRIVIVQCDRCKEQLETNAATDRIANETAERNGWVITDKGDWLKERHYCPKCKKILVHAEE